MQPSFHEVELDEIRDEIRAHLSALPGPVDSFVEGHITGASHYRIVVSGEAAGFASIHGSKLITQFSLRPGYQRFGQTAFLGLRRMETVGAAFVPTCDEFFLAHALDDYRQLFKQAYLFVAAAPGAGGTRKRAPDGYALRPAEAAEIAFIRERTSGFFEDLERHIRARELFVVSRGEAPVGFGVVERSELMPGNASIGMYTIETFRRTGVGAATIALLLDACAAEGLRPIAGCWYYNHVSKRALERAGMVSPARLLRVEY